ncbi:MAG: hypothetical protein K2G88_00930 [Oscillospiraceae bacterium]|nr:hypothetical protein [Oscillospiraceae bacterium]
MKLRQDFITNSSSTSFIISLKDEWNENNFFKTLGVLDDSALRNIFADLYKTINYDKEEINTYMKKYYPEMSTVEEFLSFCNYSNDVIEKVSQLIKEGRIVYYGKLSSNNGESVEAFFCMESFLICEDDIYFNGQSAVW